MLARRLVRPLGLTVTPCCTRGATSAAASPADAAAVTKRNQELLKNTGLPEARPGIFTSVLSDYVGERLGATGVYTLGAGLFMCGISKQVLLYNEETSLFFPTVMGLYVMTTKAWQILAENADRFNIHHFTRLYSLKTDVVDILQSGIDAAKSVEEEVSIRKDVFDVLRSNSAMYRETLHRERQAVIREEILKRLQHQADLEATRRRVQQAHMITWIQREVEKDVGTQLDEQAVMKSCLSELQEAVKEARASA